MAMTPRCTGFVRLRARAQGWMPCPRARVEGDQFCQKHRDWLDGAVFGIFSAKEPCDGKKVRSRLLRARNKKKRQLALARKTRAVKKARKQAESLAAQEAAMADCEQAGEQKESRQTSEAAKARPKRHRRKRVRLGEAMRKIGLDEYTVAEKMAGLIENLGRDKSEAKVLLDALKESMRYLEPQKRSGGGESDAPTMVTLSHSVPRPLRGNSDTPPDAKAAGEE